MAFDLVDYEKKTAEAIRMFWQHREQARQKQLKEGKEEVSELACVTSGKHMEGFISLIEDVVRANGLPHAEVHRARKVVTLPGYFRSTKLWDIIVLNEGRLVAAIEVKSQAGAFSKNFNNRAEEAIGTGQDFKVAFRDGAFGGHDKPFVGWLMLVEDCPESNAIIRDSSPHFPIYREFKDTTYLERYHLLCVRMKLEELYTSAAVIKSPKTAIETGLFNEVDQSTGLKNFLMSLAKEITFEAARAPGVPQRVPMYDLKAAAGDFSELQQVAHEKWVNVPEGMRASDDLFACTVVGESMNEKIPNGAVCLFRKETGGSREGKIVLVQYADLHDTDMGSYTVKEYHSTKAIDDDGNWIHKTITLNPLSTDRNFDPIELSAEQKESLKVIGIFERVLEVTETEE